MAALLLVPLSAVAGGGGTDTAASVASGSSSAYEHDADNYPLDCTIPESRQFFCCHLASPYFQATGQVQSLDVDQPALAAHPAAPAQEVVAQPLAASTHIPITAPPRYILFGNFRS